MVKVSRQLKVIFIDRYAQTILRIKRKKVV